MAIDLTIQTGCGDEAAKERVLPLILEWADLKPEHNVLPEMDLIEFPSGSGHLTIRLGVGLTPEDIAQLRAAMANRPPAPPTEPLSLDPQPWVFVSDQVFGVRSAEDKGIHPLSGGYYDFKPRPEYEQDRARYDAAAEEEAR